MKALGTAVNSITTAVGHTKTWAKMNSPEIMLFAGLAAGVGALITTQRATLKVDTLKKTVDDKKMKIAQQVCDYEEHPDDYEEPYTNEIAVNDMKLLKAKTAVEYVKLYAGPIILEVVSIGLILGSHHVMKQRQAALAASCALLRLIRHIVKM